MTNPGIHDQSSLIDLPTLAEQLATTPRHLRRLVAERPIPHLKMTPTKRSVTLPGADAPGALELAARTGAGSQSRNEARTRNHVRFGIPPELWDAAVERAVAESTRAQNLPFLVADETALATIAGIIDSEHGRNKRTSRIERSAPSPVR